MKITSATDCSETTDSSYSTRPCQLPTLTTESLLNQIEFNHHI